MTTNLNKKIEIWRQDNETQDLWHGENNLIINTSALNERETYLEIMRIPSASGGFWHNAQNRMQC